MRGERISVCFVISLLVHLVLLSVGVFAWPEYKRFTIPGSEQAVQAHLVYESTVVKQPLRSEPHQSREKSTTKSEPTLLSPDARKVTLAKPKLPKLLKKEKPQQSAKKHLSKRQKKSAKPATKGRERGLKGEELNQLVILLFRAINQHKLYPAQARALSLRGTVTLSFLLSPDGQVSDIHIQHSSGQRLLDQAAIKTLKRSQPFQGVERYIKHAQSFLIPVKYG